MIQFQCPSCQRTLQTAPEAQGQLVPCPCGVQIRVPRVQSPAAMASTSSVAESRPASATSSGGVQSYLVACTCGKKLRAPASAVGKAIRCPCGQLVSVPGSQAGGHTAAPSSLPAAPVIAPRQAENPNWLDGLPPASMPRVVSSPHLYEQDYWDAPEVVEEVQEDAGYRPATADLYLERAKEDVRNRGQHNLKVLSEQMNGTRWLLIFIGAVTVGYGVYRFWIMNDFVDQLIAKDESIRDRRETILMFGRIANIFDIGIGLLYIVFGSAVVRFPVATTMAGMTIFLFGNFLKMVGSPETFFTLEVLLVRGLITAALVKSVIDALTYRIR